MATAGNSTAAGAAHEGGARVGGKFRKRPFRKHQATPYDRPPTVLRNPQRYGWLSKVVDPASKLITSTANRIFGSVFRKRLLPPTEHSPGQIRDARNSQPVLPLTENHSAVCEQGNRESRNPNISFNSNGVTELEHMLKQKTFTRSEIDRLAAVLHSKAADGTLGDEKEKCEVKAEGPPVNCAKQREVVSGSLDVNGSLPLVLPGTVSTPAIRSRDLRDASASPAELAKAYMFERSAKASTSFMGSQSQQHNEDLVASSDVPFHQRSPNLSLAPKAGSKVGISENGFLTPRSRGRSAIYRMARTPYPRTHSIATYKGAGTVINPHNETHSSTSSRETVENVHFDDAKKLVLKRRSSVLESDIGTGGPIRRIRQKRNLLYSKSLALPSVLSQGQSASLDGQERKTCGHVSSRSIEMGKKILDTLETLTPPKEKPSPKKLTIVEGGLEITPSMLRGQALRSLEKVNSFEGFVKNQNDYNLAETASHHVLSSSYNRQETDADKTAEKCLITPDKSDSEHGNNVRFGNGDPLPSDDRPVVYNASMVSLDVPKTRQAFRMSAHEDYLELDDDMRLNEVASTSLNEGRERLRNSSAEGKAETCSGSPALDSGTRVDKPDILPKSKFLSSNRCGPESTMLNKSICLESSSNHTIDETGTDFTFPRFPASSSAVSIGVQPAVAVPKSISEANNVPLLNEAEAAAPVFSFGLASSGKVSPVGLHSLSSAVQLSRSTNDNLASSSSFADVDTVAVSAVSKAPKVDEAAKEDVNLFKSSENGTTSLLPVSISSTSPVGILNNGGSSKNGSLGLVFGSSASSPAPVSSGGHQTVSNGFLQPPSTSATIAPAAADSGTVADASASFSTSSALGSCPSFSAGSVFAFGSSSVSSTSSVLSTSVFKSSDPGYKTKDSTFANQTSSAASTPANVGSGLFSFCSSSSVGDGNLQISNASEPDVSTLFASDTKSMHSHLATSASITAVGSSVSSTSGSGSSVFGSFAALSPALVSSPSSGPSSTSGSGSFVFGSFAASSPALVSSLSSGLSSTSGSGSSVFGSFAALSPALVSSSSSGPSSTSGSGSSVFGSFASSSPAFVSSSGSSSLAQSVDSSSGTVAGIFDSSCQPAIGISIGSGFKPSSQRIAFAFGAYSGSSATSNSAPSQSSGFIFGASSGPGPTSNSAQTLSTGFTFGLSSCSGSASASNSVPMVFGSTGSSPGSVFSFTSAVSTSTPTITSTTPAASQPGFGSSSPAFAFGIPVPSGSNDQMNMEDSMAEDSVQASTPPGQVFGQPSTTAFLFTSGGCPFQFGAPQSQVVSQNPSSFQPSSSLDFSTGTGGGGSSFSLGAGGTDKSNRRIVKVKSKFRKR